MYGNGGRMHVILNGEQLEEVDCFKINYQGLQMAADGGCERGVVHRMNEEYRACGALKSVLSNRGLGINKQTNNNDLLEKDGGTKNCIYKD